MNEIPTEAIRPAREPIEQTAHDIVDFARGVSGHDAAASEAYAVEKITALLTASASVETNRTPVQEGGEVRQRGAGHADGTWYDARLASSRASQDKQLAWMRKVRHRLRNLVHTRPGRKRGPHNGR